MSWSSYKLEYNRHLVRLHCRRRRAQAPMGQYRYSHDIHEKINSCVTLSFLYWYGAPLGAPSGSRNSATKYRAKNNIPINRRCTGIPSRGEQQYSQSLNATETGISSGLMGCLGLYADFTLPYVLAHVVFASL